MEIGRLLTAMITPFHENGDVNYEMASKLAKAIVDSGSDGLVIGGTTGEAPTISDDEKLKLFSVIKESIGTDHALIAGTTNNNTKESIKLVDYYIRPEIEDISFTDYQLKTIHYLFDKGEEAVLNNWHLFLEF